MLPHEIESLSFSIIDREAGAHGYSDEQWTVVRRMIHTSADFDYQHTVRMTSGAVKLGIEALRRGKKVIVDTNMVRAGIRAKEIEAFGGCVKCLMTDPGVVEYAEKNRTTRAEAAVDSAVEEMRDGIYVIGNAPTALLRLIELMERGQAQPALVIGLPVGFVNAAEAKAKLCSTSFQFVSNVGRKGGSNVAASVVNALIVLATGREAYE